MTRHAPEAMEVFNSVQQYAGSDPDTHLCSNPLVVGDPEVNVFQLGIDVVIQKSICEGFGLTVAEAMWKETPDKNQYSPKAGECERTE